VAKADQPERGTKSPYSARFGVDVGDCTGLDLSHDPSTIADTALRQAINVRVHDGIVLNRGGQATTKSGMDGCVQGLIDIDGVGVRGVLATDERVITAAGIGTFDENLRQDPADDSNVFYVDGDPFEEHPVGAPASGNSFDDSAGRISYAWWDGHVVFQDTISDELFKLIMPEEGVAPADMQRESLFTMVVPGEVAAVNITSFATLPQTGNVDGPLPLYMGTLAGGVVAYVQGQLIRLLADATFSSRVTVFTYNNQLYAAGTHKVMYQSNGWASGGSGVGTAWTNIAMPAGPVDFRPMAAIEGLGFGWIGGWDENDSPPSLGVNSGYILKVDDSSGTPVLTVGVNGVGGGDFLYSVDDFCLGPQGQIYAAKRTGTLGGSFFADYGIWDGAALGGGPSWGESEAMVYRIAGTAEAVYGLGWGSDSPARLTKWDGSTNVNIASWNDGNPSPYDLVLI